IDLYVPFTFDARRLDRRAHDVNAYAQLKPGVSIEQAQAEMDELYRGFRENYPEIDAKTKANVISFNESNQRGARPMLLLMLSAVGAVLLIAVANVANLMLVRATVRRKELALRTALGASHARIFGQMLTESLVVAALAGVIGIVFAVWG